MSSFLAPSEFAWGNVEKTTEVEVVTLDSFSVENNINFIHILKSDTQGYDLEVFKGAEGLMRQNQIGLIYCELIFSNMYKNMSLHFMRSFASSRIAVFPSSVSTSPFISGTFLAGRMRSSSMPNTTAGGPSEAGVEPARIC